MQVEREKQMRLTDLANLQVRFVLLKSLMPNLLCRLRTMLEPACLYKGMRNFDIHFHSFRQLSDWYQNRLQDYAEKNGYQLIVQPKNAKKLIQHLHNHRQKADILQLCLQNKLIAVIQNS
mmetsp:Transcript_14796/g.25168  ORF Transcript_14796/g.25168 Transcript_14796/m.25168 type:complete len:120 (-) Transcript_14796:106-465(-)